MLTVCSLNRSSVFYFALFFVCLRIFSLFCSLKVSFFVLPFFLCPLFVHPPPPLFSQRITAVPLAPKTNNQQPRPHLSTRLIMYFAFLCLFRCQLSHEINGRYRIPPTWWTASAALVDTPPPVMPHLACATCSREGLCTRCKVDAADAATRLKVCRSLARSRSRSRPRSRSRLPISSFEFYSFLYLRYAPFVCSISLSTFVLVFFVFSRIRFVCTESLSSSLLIDLWSFAYPFCL